MKKNLVLAGALLLSVVRADAQQNPVTRHRHNPETKALIQNILSRQSAGKTALKPTGIQQRVIAQATEFFLFENNDSVTFKYSGARGSEFDFNYMEYLYSDGSNNNYDPIFRFSEEPDPLSVLADTVKRYQNGEWYNTRAMHRRPDNKVDSAYISNDNGMGSLTSFSVFNFFNTQGLLTYSYNQQEVSGGVVDTGYAKQFTYNNAGTREESDTTYLGWSGVTIAVGAVTYHYNNTNRLDSATYWDLENTTLVLGSRTKFTYNTNGKLSTLKNYDYSTGTPRLHYADTFGYTNGADYFTFYQEDYYNQDGSYSDGVRDVKYVGANGLPDSIKMFEREDPTAAFGHSGTIFPTYNSFNNPQQYFYLVDGTSGAMDTALRATFYYETYDDGLSIQPLADNKDFSVYPNPFTSNISIDWKGETTNEVTVSLTNIIGQQMFRKDVKLNTGKNTIDVLSFAKGFYLLQIRDANGKAWSTKLLKN